MQLKIFRCRSHVHIDDSKVSKCTFVGYCDEVFGYRFWDDQNEKTIRRKDVVFNESIMYKDKNIT